jgi:hypothetical protein
MIVVREREIRERERENERRETEHKGEYVEDWKKGGTCESDVSGTSEGVCVKTRV